MKKKWLAVLLVISLLGSMLSACGKEKESSNTVGDNTDAQTSPEVGDKGDKDLSGTLVFAIWDNLSLQLYEELDLEGRFQKLYPNANIEVEKIKDDSEYWNTMKIRASANQLPDIMYNKTFTLSRFQDYLVDVSNTEAAKNNLIAEGYKLNGKIVGLPEKMTREYVFYWKDMFAEAGVTVPTTWEEFETVSMKLQSYYGKDNKDFSAIGIGGKDEWPTYPFTEYMPALENGNGQNWNDMANQDEPFSTGTDFYNAFQKINSLFQSGAFGKDPLGIGHDQAISLFSQRQSAMIACGGWGLSVIKEGADSTDELGTFFLPTRNTTSDTFYTITQGDSFMSVTNSSKNQELALAFLEFYFSDAWYPDFIKAIADDNTLKTVTKDKDPILAQADELQPDAKLVMYDGGGDEFTTIQAETTFDYKKLGAQMLIKGFDLQSALDELNSRWIVARGKLEVK